MHPKLVIFDLDFTVWYPEMYELTGAPFKRCPKSGRVTDKAGEEVFLFPDIYPIMRELVDLQIPVAAASKTEYPKWAHQCLKLIDIDGQSLDSIVIHKEIYPKNKTNHFKKLKETTGYEYKDMLFFDNERWNIEDIKPLGVTCIHCPDGMTLQHFETGLKLFADNFKQTVE
ncbi:magnesium-dependent phosphatase-1 [Globomyces pollinis-pini]|nr:magnesium-dependent phosphatase-1 [Globomyces pollinis-pini]